MAYAGCTVSFTESSKPTYTRQASHVKKPGPPSFPPPLPSLVPPLPQPPKLLESHPQQQQLLSYSHSHPSLKSARPRRPLFSPPSKPSLRGTLTEQLSAITSVVEGVTRDLKARDSTAAPGTTTTFTTLPTPSPLISSSSLLTLPVLQLRVGRVISRRGTPIHLFSDRAEFVFAHGTCEVSMTMYFRDISPSLRASGPSVSFRVRGGDNMGAFKGDYDESNTSHCIQLTFHSSAVAAKLVEHVKRHAA